LIEARGIAGMREAISNTAELGAVLGGPRIVDDHVRERMREVLADVRSGQFAGQLKAEADAGYPVLDKARSSARDRKVERVFNELRKLSGAP
jgi:ketol-acid reductoisomerase